CFSTLHPHPPCANTRWSPLWSPLASHGARHCVIRVRDDGPGIPQQLLPSVFERFTRGDVSRARGGPTEGGSGLGLAIVEAVTVAHGGRIHVESAPGRTEFTLELPPAEGARTPDPASAPAPASA
ncbi:sensor histidine kinase, partial [Streptomyces sp. NPDC059697]|uniref:sensor histidine kinase n=1 Tax=Streptomyces sp. NPDC059697 TaxID=3346912 RepID=UPI0036961896